jgi:hypothetical protein
VGREVATLPPFTREFNKSVRTQPPTHRKAFLFLQDWQYFVVDGVRELFIFAWFGGEFDDSGELGWIAARNRKARD